METNNVSKFIKESIEWKSMFAMINAVGDTLNGRKDRFDKAEIIERGLAKYSSGKILHIDDIGADHYIPELDIRIEVKFVKNNLFTKVGKQPKSHSNAKLTNTLGSSDQRQLEKTFDYLLLLEVSGAALISYEDLLEYVESNGDGLHAKIPFESLDIIQQPSDISIEESLVTSVSYKKEKDEAIDRFLESFVTTVEEEVDLLG
jgi:hypothetical protein